MPTAVGMAARERPNDEGIRQARSDRARSGEDRRRWRALQGAAGREAQPAARSGGRNTSGRASAGECIIGGAGPEGRTHRHRPRWLGLVVWRWRDERDWRIVDWRSSSFFGGRRLKKRANDVHLVELRVHLESFSLCGALSPEFLGAAKNFYLGGNSAVTTSRFWPKMGRWPSV